MANEFKLQDLNGVVVINQVREDCISFNLRDYNWLQWTQLVRFIFSKASEKEVPAEVRHAITQLEANNQAISKNSTPLPEWNANHFQIRSVTKEIQVKYNTEQKVVSIGSTVLSLQAFLQYNVEMLNYTSKKFKNLPPELDELIDELLATFVCEWIRKKR